MINKDLFGPGLRSIANDLKEYFESRFQLMILKVGEKVSIIISDAIQNLTILFIIGIGVMLLFLSLGFYLGQLTGNNAMGFLIMAAAAFLLGGIMLLFKPKGISKRIHGRIMNEILDVVDDLDNSENKEKQYLPKEAQNEQ